MEELFVYAILCSIGYDLSNEYGNTLDKLFLSNPENEDYLELEGLQYKDAVLHTLSIMNRCSIDHDTFGKYLMETLKPIYKQSEISDFAKKMHTLWNRLPRAIEYGEDPFFVFNYADDCLSYGDEKQCRDLYESAMNYYDMR
ncbi:MAG: hypothetical protein ACI4F0_04070 [Agathobacter sp.]